MIRIRRAREDEAARLTEIAHVAKRHWGYPEHWIEIWREQLTLSADDVKRYPVYAAVDGDRLVGFYALEPTGEGMELGHLWVVPEMMGQGVGRALLAHARDRAAGFGASTLEILSDPNAERFYHRQGARTVGRVDASLDGVTRHLPLMSLTVKR